MSGLKPGGSLRGYIALSACWLVVLCVVVFLLRRPAPTPPIEILPPASPSPTIASPTPTPAGLRVDVAGAVNTPGVYTLSQGSIVMDAIDAAGGPALDADLDRLNKASGLQDGIQIYVPRVAETALPVPVNPKQPSISLSPGATQAPGPIDINKASAEELDSLPGVGPVTARRIIDGRPYANVEDIVRVAGIGPATLEKLRPYLTVR